MLRSIGRRAPIVAGAMVATIALAGTAGAQSPRPSPMPAPTPAGFTAHAHANVTVVAQGGTFDGSVQLAVAQRANLTRVDVLSVKSDTLPIPPIGATAVIDHTAHTLTVWNDATKTYHVQGLPWRGNASASASPQPSPQPSRSPRPARPSRSFLADLDVLAMTIKLTGHTTTSGLPTSGLAFDFQVQRKGDKAASHVIATTQLADDYAIFPMTLDVSVEPGMVPYSAKLSYAVDDIARGMPPPERFAIPAGYTEARSILEVFFQRRRPAMPAPSPSPR